MCNLCFSNQGDYISPSLLDILLEFWSCFFYLLTQNLLNYHERYILSTITCHIRKSFLCSRSGFVPLAQSPFFCLHPSASNNHCVWDEFLVNFHICGKTCNIYLLIFSGVISTVFLVFWNRSYLWKQTMKFRYFYQ